MSKEIMSYEANNNPDAIVRAVGYGTRSYVELPPDLFDPHAYREAESKVVLGSRDPVRLIDAGEGIRPEFA